MTTAASSTSPPHASVDNWVNGLPGIDASDKPAVTQQSSQQSRKTKKTIDDVLAASGTKRDTDRLVINPEVQPAMQYWDIATILGLAFVAVVSPFEVALLQTEINGMFVLNRLIDVMFAVDLVLQFFVAYRVKTRYGHRLETRMKNIARHYLATWFVIDFVSLIPYDLLGLIFQSPELQKAKTLRITKLLRLLKLARVLRASRIFQRWETVLAINYNELNLWKAMIMFGVGSHWIACMWALLATQADEGEETWLTHSVPASGQQATLPSEIYLTSLYWSAMTVTSIGYGDVLPVNLFEQVVCVILMFASSFLWARVLSDIMNAITNGDTHKLKFRQTLDDLNYMMADQNLPGGLRRRLRGFFFQVQNLQRVQSFQGVIEQMSPALQGELALTVNEVWVRKVWYFDAHFDALPPAFVVGVAGALHISVYAQQELFGEPWTLYILHRGLCVRSLRVLRSGSVWGEDFVLSLESHALVDNSQACALTFVEVASLTRDSFKPLLERFPHVQQLIRKATVRIAVRAGILTEATRRRRIKGEASTSFLSFASPDSQFQPAVFCRQNSGLISLEDKENSNNILRSVEQKQEHMQKQLDKLTGLVEQVLERLPQRQQSASEPPAVSQVPGTPPRLQSSTLEPPAVSQGAAEDTEMPQKAADLISEAEDLLSEAAPND